MQKVEVIWVDAWSDTAQVKLKMLDDMKPVARRDVGYLIRANKKEVVLVGGIIEWSKTKEEEDLYENELIIPRGMIIKIIPLKDDND